MAQLEYGANGSKIEGKWYVLASKIHREKLLLSHILHLLPHPAISEMYHKGAGKESVTVSQ